MSTPTHHYVDPLWSIDGAHGFNSRILKQFLLIKITPYINHRKIDHGFSCLDEEGMEVKETVKKDI